MSLTEATKWIAAGLAVNCVVWAWIWLKTDWWTNRMMGKTMTRDPLGFMGDNRIKARIYRFACRVIDAHTIGCRGHSDCREARRWSS